MLALDGALDLPAGIGMNGAGATFIVASALICIPPIGHRWI